jgi:hypothetical protein
MHHGGGAGAGDSAAVQGVRFIDGLRTDQRVVAPMCVLLYVSCVGISALYITILDSLDDD